METSPSSTYVRQMVANRILTQRASGSPSFAAGSTGGPRPGHPPRRRLGRSMTVYLDHAATTPILPEAAAAMTALLGRVGNASSLHASGREARRVVEESRERIAGALGCRPGEVVFTSGGTESDNLAIKGLFWARRAEDPRRVRILSTPIEHHAVLDPLRVARHRGRQGRADRRRPAGSPRPRRLPRGDRVRPRERRAGHGDVGQQRGRHRAAGAPRWSRSRTPTASRCTPTPCRRSASCRSTSPAPVSTR